MPGARHDILGKPVYPLFVPPVGRDLYRYVLVLYLERPATQQYAVACSRSGRFGYSDLKEAAHMGVYVLWIGRSGCRWFGNMPSWVGSVCLVAE